MDTSESTSVEHQAYAPHPESRIAHVGTYRRIVGVTLARMYENALDWEHLPYVHATTFAEIELLDAGDWGWRAALVSTKGQRSVIELALDRSLGRWISRNLEGPSKGAEIWTNAFELAPSSLRLVIDFFVPDVADHDVSKVAAAYTRSYTTLYDEDVAMMVAREDALQRRAAAALPNDVRAGTKEQREPSQEPIGAAEHFARPRNVEFAGRQLIVSVADQEVRVCSAVCPHRLAPLNADGVSGDVVRCGWHGYEFDVGSGACVSGQYLSLSVPVVGEIRDREVWLRENG